MKLFVSSRKRPIKSFISTKLSVSQNVLRKPARSFLPSQGFRTSRPLRSQDYYQLLDVSKSATSKEIKAAFLKKVKEYHPDANPSDPEANRKFLQISQAYEVLKDEDKRKQYDLSKSQKSTQYSKQSSNQYQQNQQNQQNQQYQSPYQKNQYQKQQYQYQQSQKQFQQDFSDMKNREEFMRHYNQRFAHILEDFQEILNELKREQQDTQKHEYKFKRHKNGWSETVKVKTRVFYRDSREDPTKDYYHPQKHQQFDPRNRPQLNPTKWLAELANSPLVKFVGKMIPAVKKLADAISSSTSSYIRLLPKTFALQTTNSTKNWSTHLLDSSGFQVGAISMLQPSQLEFWTSRAQRKVNLNYSQDGLYAKVTDPTNADVGTILIYSKPIPIIGRTPFYRGIELFNSRNQLASTGTSYHLFGFGQFNFWTPDKKKIAHASFSFPSWTVTIEETGYVDDSLFALAVALKQLEDSTQI